MSYFLNCCRLFNQNFTKLNNICLSRSAQLIESQFPRYSKSSRNCFFSLKRWEKLSVKNISANSRLAQTRRILSPWRPLTLCIASLGTSGIVVATLKRFSFLLVTVANCENELLETTKNSDDDEDEDEDKVEDAAVLEREFPWIEFLRLLLPDAWYLLGAVASALCVAYVNVEIPLLLGGVVDILAKYATSSEGRDFTEDIRRPALRLASMYILQGILTFTYISLLSAVGERLAARMRKELFHTVLIQDMSFFDTVRTGEIVNRLTSDVQDFKSSFKSCVSQGLRNMAQTLGCLASLFYISPQLTGLMAVAVAGLISVGSLMGSRLRKLSRKAQEQVSKSTSVADEAISNVRTVRAFAMEKKEIDLYAREIDASADLNQMLGIGIGIFQGLSNIALNGMALATLYVGGYYMSHDDVKAGDLMSFMVATQTIQRSLGQMSMLFGQAVRGLSAGSRVFEYMSLKPSMPIIGGKTIPYHTLTGNIKFSNVNFTYPNRPNQMILKDFTLDIPGGRMVALVGPSGSGKSTVAALLERFYDVDSGSITLDDRDLRTLDPSWLRSRVIGFINQEPVLFADTVMENIRFGCPNATDTEVIEAAKLSNAHDFISSFPDGYQTMIGERGTTVSGGQKQRIAIARALIKKPTILLLDEATSALDSESERVVQEAIDRVIKGHTVLVIAHRMSTIKDADCIAVVLDGQIVELGTHAELKEKKGAYWQLIKSQQMMTDAEPLQQG